MTVSGPLGRAVEHPAGAAGLAVGHSDGVSEVSLPAAEVAEPDGLVAAARALASTGAAVAGTAPAGTPSGRFGRRDRILLQREFKAVLQNGWRGRGPHLQVIARRRSADAEPNARLGMSVSKQLGNSPARAHMRRLIREAFRALRGAHLGGVDVVVLARIPWPLADLTEVSAEMSKIFDYVCSNLDRERRTRSLGDRRPQRGPTP